MTYYTVTLGLGGALAAAVAVEWTNQPAPLDGGAGWEPCLRLADGTWRFSSRDPEHAAAPHRRGPGPFSGLAIRYRLAPAGPWSAAAEPRKDIVILETREGEVVPVLPAVLAAPTLLGAGEIGTDLTLDPGLWSGIPAPALSFQWRRDGADLPGETARAYLPGPADDRCALSCAVSARNLAGTTVALAGPVVARHPAPRLLGALPEEIFDEGTGAQAVETAFAFAGAALAFAAEGARVDPVTGVLSIPTRTPVSGALVRVTAANSGGAVTATLRYTVEAAPARPLGAADVTILRSVWRPEGQRIWLSPVVAFPGLVGETAPEAQWTAAPDFTIEENWHPVVARAAEAGTHELRAVNHPVPAGAFDAALFRADDSVRRGRLRFRWRASPGTRWSDASGTFVVPAPIDDALPAPSPTILAESMGVTSKLRYVDGQDYGINRPASSHTIFVAALGALAGVTTSYGGKTPAAYVREQISYWMQGGNAPFAAGGPNGQQDFVFCATIALAQLVPTIWETLTATERLRIDRVMEGCLVSAAWQNADRNPWVATQADSDERTIRGRVYGRRRLPNFTAPSALTPLIVAAYMGRERGASAYAAGAAAAGSFLDRFDRAAFAAAIASAGGLEELLNTFDHTWTAGALPGPSAADLAEAVRGYTYHGFSLADVEPTFIREVDNMWGATIQVGLLGHGGDPYGIFEPLTAPGANNPNTGRNDYVGRLKNRADWAALRNVGMKGMARELDGRDGSVNGSPAGPRSSCAYSHDGARVLLIGTVALAAYGLVDRSSVAVREVLAQQSRGVQDLIFRTERGYRDFAKGGRIWNNRNEDWDAAYAANWRLASLWGIWTEVGAPWAGV